MLIALKVDEYINTAHILLMKIITNGEGQRILKIEFINGMLLKYPETETQTIEQMISVIKQSNRIEPDSLN